ncbi:hypothetical protein HS088_TW21G01552 [Tripterygium wilfordii]|uniref:Glutaredoxin domain-containing protein n=1 Tax=Tripterygium wilfordii TaxID=458696 RepID=A0A7J7C6B6_TRIWF|nr:uncharacterized protein LOC119989311 [Tripterygium wilfordii]KAF5729387.1 hypothetical protein HS088_TW21G01552 [Tripterygium wilfordii]
MKGLKGKLLKKLKSVNPPQIGYLKPDRILHVNPADGFVEFLPRSFSFKPQTLFSTREEPEKPKEEKQSTIEVQELDIVDVAELIKDLEDEKMEFEEERSNKENTVISRKMESDTCPQTPLSEIDISSFRRPDLNSGSLFDPNLLAAFEQAVKEHVRMSEAARKVRKEQLKLEKNREEEAERIVKLEAMDLNKENKPPTKACRVEEENPLSVFEEKCPPGGSEAVIFYTTTLRGIRKTFEDCSRVRFLLDSFRVSFYERDVSMHTEFKEELWKILGGKAVPPRLFIKGRHIGGAEEVLGLHEQGKLRLLFEGIPINRTDSPCKGCAGFRFILCSNCNGSHKVIADDDGLSSKCEECNENGLKICPICCC